MTGRVLVKVDREVDAYQHIDRVREEVSEHVDRLEALERDVKLLQQAERDRLTQTGVWTFVKAKLEAEAVGWMKWAIRAALMGAGAATIKAAEWLIRRAMHP